MKRTFLPLSWAEANRSNRTVVLPTPGAPAAMMFVPGIKPPSVDANLSKIVPVSIGINKLSLIFKSSNLVRVTTTGFLGALVDWVDLL